MKKVLFFGVIMLVLSSCLKREQYPNRPDIEYLSYSFTADTIPSANPIGEVTFRFTDGDGDLGLNPADTFGVHAIGEPYYYNLFVRYFEKKNGV
ncbi:MAG: membrane lipoprotein lipid attachment site-containing protein, partial [Flavobacteriales bacterium]